MVGAFAGAGWAAPQGIANIDDVLSAIQSFQELDTAPRFTRTDVEPEELNRIPNINDVLVLIKAFQGDDYPFSSPAGCL